MGLCRTATRPIKQRERRQEGSSCRGVRSWRIWLQLQGRTCLNLGLALPVYSIIGKCPLNVKMRQGRKDKEGR